MVFDSYRRKVFALSFPPHKAAGMALLALTACSPSMDMQGVNPVDYYAEHPIKNAVETRETSFDVHFADGQEKLSPSEIDKLSANLHAVSMPAVLSIRIGYSASDTLKEKRKLHLTRMLHNMGYSKGEYAFVPLPKLKRGDMELELAYSVVVLPDCPDWRTSPVTTHSNTTQGNFNCATEVNTGLMVADPHDLVRGTGDVPIDTVTAAKAIEDYHGGGGAAASGAGGGSASSGGSGGSSGSGSSGGGSSGASSASPSPSLGP